MRDGSDFKEPDVGNGSSKVDMTHALTANAGKCNFNTAFLADNAFVFHALIFAAQAFVVFDRAKDTRTEQAVTLRLERTIVDGFRLFDFTERPDIIRSGAGNRNPNLESKALGNHLGLKRFMTSWFM